MAAPGAATSRGAEASQKPSLSPRRRPSTLVLYATQTGTAAGLAHLLADTLAHTNSLRLTCLPADQTKPRYLKENQLLIALVATAGDGQATETIKPLWDFLKRADLPSNSLKHLKFATFGLGDSSYPKFNYAAKRFHKRLAQLGAQPLTPLGLGDEQDGLGLEFAFFPWIQALWDAIALQRQLVSFPAPQLPPKGFLPPPRYSVASSPPQLLLPTNAAGDALSPDEIFAPPEIVSPAPNACRQSPWMAPVLVNRRLTPTDSTRDVRHIELDLQGSGLEDYEPGDALAVQPRNSAAAVEKLVVLLGFDPEATVSVQRTVDHAPFLDQSIWTVKDIFTNLLDVFGVPRRRFFEMLAHFATDARQAERLAEFGLPEGAAGRDEYATRPRRTYAEVLADFRSARPPLAYYFDLIPQIQERYFSIASSRKLFPGRAHICVAVVKYRSMLEAPRLGVASNFLASLRPAAEDGRVIDRVGVWLRSGCVRLPTHSEVPLLMFGPGTGVAPFRAFLQHRYVELMAGKRVGPATLFFGCRRATVDFLYGEEFEKQYVANGALTTLVTAFSREGEKKVYVQHRLAETAVGGAAWTLLQREGSHVYIAGSAGAMPRAVLEALRKVCVVHGGLSYDKACEYLVQLERSGRLQVDCW